MKENKKLKIALALTSLISISLTSFITYQYFNSDNEKAEVVTDNKKVAKSSELKTAKTTETEEFKCPIYDLETFKNAEGVEVFSYYVNQDSDALEIAEQLNKKGVKLHILNMGLIDNSPIGKLMFTVFSAFSEFERDLIVERMQEGKEYKRKHDPDFRDGRKSKLNTKQLEIIYKHFADGILTNEEIANMFNVSRRTIMYRKKEWKDMKNMGKL
ncbi:recombinase family protein [Enterococcus faecalis]|uniref:recombinase family protein n=1 Tax=Enterococcus faecalis TaxID=1351 RepID=UPI0021E004D5|nr:recombinase family protein [Enterococcus faecalis]MCU9757159.1 recombinase family protein [Enterococcus faecalis]MCU9774322.1 recombinase family protein [Enterococcus faecalis]MCU9790708.1 recombinase family protein [Enterococcus faecalis]